MAEHVTPYGVGFLVDEHAALSDDSFHEDITAALNRARALAGAHPGRGFDVYLAIEVMRAEPQAGWTTPPPTGTGPRVATLAVAPLAALSLAVADIDRRGPGREPTSLFSDLDGALREAGRQADRYPGCRFGVYVRAQRVRLDPPVASSAEPRP